jgi:hypothetical protein
MVALFWSLPLNAQTLRVSYNWAPPTSGEPAVSYNVQRTVDGAAIPDTSVTTNSLSFDTEPNKEYLLRVAAVDRFGRTGAYSEWALPFLDVGAPNAPGLPLWVIELVLSSKYRLTQPEDE